MDNQLITKEKEQKFNKAEQFANPLISIIIPVYNAQNYLEKCVRSVMQQTYSMLQIILVDDGSSDDSAKLCDYYANEDSRIEVLHKKNEGVSKARNYGLQVAKGDYIGFVDADDWIHPQMYEHLLYLIRFYDADISTVEIIRTEDENYEFQEQKENIHNYNKNDYLFKFFKVKSQQTVYYIYNKLYKRYLIDKELFPEKYSVGEDVIATYKIILNANSVVASNKKMYCYRQNTGITSRFNENFFSLTEIWEEIEKLTYIENPEYIQFANLNRARINFTILSELAISGQYLRYWDRVEILLKELKKESKKLLTSQIAFSRKIMIIWFCISYRSVAWFLEKFVNKRQ